jgi:hypothetical protein
MRRAGAILMLKPSYRQKCLYYYREGAPFNGIRDCSQRELRLDSDVRGTQHASRRSTSWGVKPADNVSASASHSADDRPTPATYADDKEPVEAS